jgi:hypothetical protein
MQYRIITAVKISQENTLQPGDLYEGFTPEDAAELIAIKAIEPAARPFTNT